MKITILFLFLSIYGNSQILEKRRKQLDSLVTNIDKNTLRNLDSLHLYLHSKASNDEERIFMYFGLIAIHYKYDFKRKKDKTAKEYSVYYIAQKKSGVCRDFAVIFKELCLRSDIPCVLAYGQARGTLWDEIKAGFKKRIKRVNHVWNIVKINNVWRPVDPTWSGIDSIRKYYSYGDNKRKRYAGKVKISNRSYYDKVPMDFYLRRTAIHPAYYCMDNIYTYKTSMKIYSKRNSFKM